MNGYGFSSLFLRVVRSLEWVGRPVFYLLTGLFFLGIFACGIVGRGVIFFVEWLWRKFVAVFFNSWQYFQKTIERVRLPEFRLPFFSRRAKLFFVLFSIFIFLLSTLLSSWFFLLKNLPKPGELTTRPQEISTKIYDRNGRLLYKIFRDKNRSLVKLDELPSSVKQATIAIEDKDFYSHAGFSVRGILRALWRNVTRGEMTGGSTITQQLVKNALLSPEKSLVRKVREVILAVQVELVFSKDEILEMYLNEVSYGGAAYGIEEAAQLYFGKPAASLTLAESALLAGLPKAPTTYSPFGANPYLARARQLEVLARMVQDGYITQEKAEEAAMHKLVFAPQRTNIKAPHFVMYVKQLLAEKYGERVVEEGGLTVKTSLDLDVQEMAEKVVSDELEKIRGLNISNGAALVTNPKSGEILAMVGSKDYFNQDIDGNFNITTASRQPGSSIKPVNYAKALETGRYTATTILSDTPITYQIIGSKPYSPKNYDNRFHGKIPLRVALASSYNVPAVKVLASYGVAQMIDMGRRMGITSWEDPTRYGLSLTLGGGEVKMVDMAVVYGVLANYGKRVSLRSILQVTDYRGRVLEVDRCQDAQTEGVKLAGFAGRLSSFLKLRAYAAEAVLDLSCSKQVLDGKIAYILTSILTDNEARAPAFGANSRLVIPWHPEVAVKTGTTQNLRDNWAIGYTKDYVVAAWVGNNDNTPMSYVASGITGATPIWQKIMLGLVAAQPSIPWEKPQGIVEVNICPLTGTLPCEGCPSKREYFIAGTQPTQACNLKEEVERKKEERVQEGEVLSDEDALELLGY